MDTLAFSEIAERIDDTRKAMTRCLLCPRKCGVNRMLGEKGYCKLDWQGYCFREMVVDFEEEGLNPSHQIYLSGCNLRCEFCSVGEFNTQPCDTGKPVNSVKLAERIVKQQSKGARTLNLLGGEPAVNLYTILCLLADLPVTTTVVWNSNMYYDSIVDKLTDGLIDIYLADFKCGNANCAASLLDAADYVEIAKSRIKDAAAKKQTIVRHLLIPGHFECCTRPILGWLASEARGVKVSIRGDYIPPADSAVLPLAYVSQKEAAIAAELTAKIGLELIK
jgi:putative pyruvate formate lyase activating enzyme